MNRSLSKMFTLAAVAALWLQGCREQRVPTEVADSGPLAASMTSTQQADRYLVVFVAERVPVDFGTRVSKLGGSLEASLDNIGVATVTGLTAAAVAQLAADPDIQTVEPDVGISGSHAGAAANDVVTEEEASAAAAVDATASPTEAQFYPQQWNMRAVFASDAWAAGQLGSRDVVVGLLDSGIDYLHSDLVGLVDLARSKSFTPDEDPVVAERFPGRLPISDIYFHGTAVAGLIASNATLLAGVNRHVTLLAVKFFDRFGQGSVAQFTSGLVYAVDQGADVINASAADDFDKRKNRGAVAAINRAAKYAFRKGALIVSAAGNDAADLDHNGDMVRLPCEAPHVLCVSGTAPTSAAGPTGPWDNVDAPAPYTAFGRSVSVAAPAGRTVAVRPIPATEFRTVWALCTMTPTETTPAQCRTGRPVWKSFGTSLSTAHVSGLAALLVAQLGHGQPGRIRARILHTADDLGAPGKDPYYGWGRINIARALGVLQ